ncbi:RsmB/NOP family class I SAM-dependent RNA methyltransferase [Fluviispira multicolorata]|nr:RsmB/NOP family class I SAM-dependent RNA methyltransferase [Fluviispira multicolorata]
MAEQKNKSTKHYEGRWPHLYKLWCSALNQESLPQFDRWLSQEFAKNSKYGSRDRRWYSECLFAGIRFGYFSLFCEEFFLKCQHVNLHEKLIKEFIINFEENFKNSNQLLSKWKEITEERFFVWIRLRYQLVYKNKSSAVSLELSSENFQLETQFFAKLISFLENSKDISFHLIFSSIPIWYKSSLEKRIEKSNWNETEVKQFLTELDSRPPLWIRINDLSKTELITQELIKEGFEFEHFDSSLKVTGAKGVFALQAYRSGLFEIQDLASQRIGQNIQVKNGQFVWDCCAGGGGKTQQIASLLKNKGVIYASDIREYKLEEVKKRARKSGFFNIRCLPWNGEKLPQFQKEVENRNGFDWVLVDAPCSSSGTWRRNPDAKYRVSSDNILSLSKLQHSILEKASKGVRVSGHLVYSTCSWVFDENEGIVCEFLKNNPNFSLVKQNLLGSPHENADTMFAAVLKRES